MRNRAEMRCLDVVLTGVHVSLENNEYLPDFGGTRYFICYLFLNKYFKFLSDKLPFTSTLTGMSEFNNFSTRGLQSVEILLPV